MSEPVRVALVAEGPTDSIVIEAILRVVLGDRRFILNQLQPEGSLAFGERGGGWAGVYRWCTQAARRGDGRLSQDQLLFSLHEALIIHVDADVAGSTYAEGSIAPDASHLPLPCDRDCPPARETTDALRAVVLSWCGEATVPAHTVMCVPSKSTEAWVVAALFPDDVVLNGDAHFECYPDPAVRLGQQPAKVRIRKTRRDYLEKSGAIRDAWPRISSDGVLGEAGRFMAEVLSVLHGK